MPKLNSHSYSEYGRVTDPIDYKSIIQQLPSKVEDIGKIVRNLIIHHNMVVYNDVPLDIQKQMIKIRPVYIPTIFEKMNIKGTDDLLKSRPPSKRILGACRLESHFLASMLKTKGFKVRLRAGYFKNIRQNRSYEIDYWTKNGEGKGIMADLLANDPQEWHRSMREWLEHQNDVDHHIEHWLCEIYNEERGIWQILDANTDFLKTCFNIEVTLFLDKEYFEYAHEAWLQIRNYPNINPDRYMEEPQDGFSHIRSQMLFDYYSLLNFESAGLMANEKELLEFIKKREFSELTDKELITLDNMAQLLSSNPSIEELISFYRQNPVIQFDVISNDLYSFIPNPSAIA